MKRLVSYIHILYKLIFGSALNKRDARYQFVTAIAKKWNLRVYNLDATWFRDEEFKQIITSFPGQGGLTAKRYNLYFLARAVSHLDGDTAECGVASGITSYIICQATERPGRLHHGFDSFEGLPQPGSADIPDSSVRALKEGDFSFGFDLVSHSLSSCRNVRLYKGWIPDRFAEISGCIFSLVHIDVDFYQPTFDSIEFFYNRTIPGGIIIFDDYGYVDTPGATQAVDKFLSDKAEKVIKLAAGHALIVKR